MEIESMLPFWNGTTMYNETVMMVSRNSEIPTANLLFEPEKILSVRSARLDRVYHENIDWIVENGVLKLMPNSSIPFMTEQDLYFDTYMPNLTMPKNGGGAVIYREGSFFHDRQIVVTYTHQAEQWEGPVPQSAKNTLPKTFEKLENRDAISLTLFGDSISVGANASCYTSVAPHLPIWGQLVANELERYYGTHVSFHNPSVGGKTSAWGVEQADMLVAEKLPDLVIIAFGMNDGSGTGIGDGVRPNVFKQNILSIIQTIRNKNPDAEFVLVGTTLPNAETFFFDQQPFYYEVLMEIASEVSGVATANMTGVHQELLRHKSFLDMTGNNINHPNDFLSRWYAQFVSEMLKRPKQAPMTAQPQTEET